MPFCTKCGTKLAEGARFCTVCGTPAPEEGSPAEPQPAAVGARQEEAGGQAPKAEESAPKSAYQPAATAPAYQPAPQTDTPHVEGVTDYTDRMDPNDVQQNKSICGLSYLFPILFFLPLVSCPNSKSGRFHANQALLVLIVNAGGGIAYGILSAIFAFIPILGTILNILIGLAYVAFALVFWIMGMVNGFGGKAAELPIIGKYRLLK